MRQTKLDEYMSCCYALPTVLVETIRTFLPTTEHYWLECRLRYLLESSLGHKAFLVTDLNYVFLEVIPRSPIRFYLGFDSLEMMATLERSPLTCNFDFRGDEYSVLVLDTSIPGLIKLYDTQRKKHKFRYYLGCRDVPKCAIRFEDDTHTQFHPIPTWPH